MLSIKHLNICARVITSVSSNFNSAVNRLKDSSYYWKKPSTQCCDALNSSCDMSSFVVIAEINAWISALWVTKHFTLLSLIHLQIMCFNSRNNECWLDSYLCFMAFLLLTCWLRLLYSDNYFWTICKSNFSLQKAARCFIHELFHSSFLVLDVLCTHFIQALKFIIF